MIVKIFISIRTEISIPGTRKFRRDTKIYIRGRYLYHLHHQHDNTLHSHASQRFKELTQPLLSLRVCEALGLSIPSLSSNHLPVKMKSSMKSFSLKETPVLVYDTCDTLGAVLTQDINHVD